jgi:hypothetical protein
MDFGSKRYDFKLFIEILLLFFLRLHKESHL